MPGARRDAALLMAHVLETDRGGVVARGPDPLDPRRRQRFEALVARRVRREPLQHLTGFQEFYGLPIRVDRRVFIPRPETEVLVDAVLAAAPATGARVLELGTGSGCIALALASTRSDLAILALESSAAALALARDNGRRLGLEGRIEFRRGDLRDPATGADATWDVVVSNPPYVPGDEWSRLQPEVRDFEPREALVPGPTGLEAYRAIAPLAARLLRKAGLLAVEVGLGQAGEVAAIFATAGFPSVATRHDLNGIERVVVGTR